MISDNLPRARATLDDLHSYDLVKLLEFADQIVTQFDFGPVMSAERRRSLDVFEHGTRPRRKAALDVLRVTRSTTTGGAAS